MNVGQAAVLPLRFTPLRERIAPDKKMSTEERLGQMLGSAVFHGALLDRRWWRRWVEAAIHHARLVDDLLWLDLDPLDPDGDGAVSQCRRWFADPITRLLIAHWHQDKLKVNDFEVDACLSAFLGGQEDEIAGTLLQHATVHWQLRIPPLLVAHARGELGSVPITANDWRRINNLSFEKSDQPYQRYKPQKSDRCREDAPTRVDAGLARILSRARWDVSKRCKSEIDAKKDAAKQAARFAETQPPSSVLRSLAAWVSFTLTRERGKLEAGIKPSTVGSYLYYLTAELLEAEDTPATWTEAALFDRYETRLGRVELDSRRTKLLDAIHDFHRFLQSTRGDLGPTPDQLEDYRAQGRVSANLITPQEYERALKLCDSDELKICLILGFRAGLRLTETLGLTVSDFFESRSGCELIVTHNRLRRLKTLASRRIIPLDVLLPADELQIVLGSVRDRRRSAEASRATGLLVGPIDSDRPLSQGPVADRLHSILHEATGIALRDHHLRHSFASYLAATLLLPDELADPTVPAALRSVISHDRKRLLVDRLLGSEKLGQHALHATSALMGHIVTPTTLRWYTHLLDLSLLHHVSRPMVEAGLPRSQACALAGQERARARLVKKVEVAATGSVYRRPKLPSVTLDGLPPDTWQVSQVRGRRADRIERVLSGPASLELLPRERPRKSKAFAKRGPDWREIVGALSPASTHSQALQWRQAAADLHALKTKSGRPRHPADVIEVPNSRRWIDFVDAHWRSDRTLLEIERRALFHVVNHWDTARCAVRFRSRPLALAWRNLLLSYGFHEEVLRLSLSGNFPDRNSAEIHGMLASADDLPGTAARRGWRGTITIGFVGEDEHRRLVRSASHFLVSVLAIREEFKLPEVQQVTSQLMPNTGRPASPGHTPPEMKFGSSKLPYSAGVAARAARWRSTA